MRPVSLGMLLLWSGIVLGGATIADPIDPTGPCLNYDDPSITLSGSVFTRIYFGPPNYGENPAQDRREGAYLLLLDSPVCVNASAHPEQDNNSLERDVILIQLAAVTIQPEVMEKALGKRATVRGLLYHRMTGHHRTQVLMDVREIHVS